MAEPQICKCQNGGICTEEGCECEEDFSGDYCENEVRRVLTIGGSSAAAVIVPVFLIVLVILTAIGLFLYWRTKRAG